ncbi:MAG: hypothetical protein RR853_08790 [Aurantimicrobium sp.]|uniref:hypothetical protein n=1 Tax=Aurantimicrobium sp. TaxID=1930784 RepID=UPI002FC5B61B
MTLAEILSIVGAVAGLIAAGAVIIVAFIQKFGKGPDQQQSEVQFGVSILQQQLQRAADESRRWLEIEKFLRDELRKTESDNERIDGLLQTANAQIRALRRERDELLNRQILLLTKFQRGEQITLADITGQPDIDREIDELEDTLTS